MIKKFELKIYNKNGDILRTIKNSSIKNTPAIKSTINLGVGTIVLNFNEKFDDFVQLLGIDFLFRGDLTVFDKNHKDGFKIFSGYISSVEPILNNKGDEVKVTFVGFGALLNRSIYRDGSGNDITETGVDPKIALENILINFNAKYFDFINSSSIETVGTNISYTFENQTWQNSVGKVRELSGGGYFWYVDGEREFTFKKKSTIAEHRFHKKTHIETLNNKKTVDGIINSVRVYYGDLTSFVSTEDLGTDGEVFKKYDEPNITDSTTAQQRADQIILENKDFKNSVKLKINSNYDLESIKIGDTCKILGLKEELPDNMQIISMSYEFDTSTLILEKQRDDLALAISNLN